MQVSWGIDINHQYHQTVLSQKKSGYTNALMVSPQHYFRMLVCLEVKGPVNTIIVMSSQSVYLNTFPGHA